MANENDMEQHARNAEQAAKMDQDIRSAEQAARIAQLRATQSGQQVSADDANAALDRLSRTDYRRWREDLQSEDGSLGFVAGNVPARELAQLVEFARQQLINQDPDLYVLQDSRSDADNQLLFWAKGATGYTTDLNKAHRFTHEEALEQQRDRGTDIPHRVGDLMQTTPVTVDRDQPNSTRVAQAESRLHRQGQSESVVYTMTKEDMDQRASEIEVIRQRDMLGKSIQDAAVAAGLVENDMELTGPQLMMLADDLGALAAGHKPSLPDFDAIRGKRIGEMTEAQQEDARELWLRQQAGWFKDHEELNFLFHRLDEARGLTPADVPGVTNRNEQSDPEVWVYQRPGDPRATVTTQRQPSLPDGYEERNITGPFRNGSLRATPDKLWEWAIDFKEAAEVSEDSTHTLILSHRAKECRDAAIELEGRNSALKGLNANDRPPAESSRLNPTKLQEWADDFDEAAKHVKTPLEATVLKTRGLECREAILDIEAHRAIEKHRSNTPATTLAEAMDLETDEDIAGPSLG